MARGFLEHLVLVEILMTSIIVMETVYWLRWYQNPNWHRPKWFCCSCYYCLNLLNLRFCQLCGKFFGMWRCIDGYYTAYSRYSCNISALSSWLHRASMIIKYITIQLMHNIQYVDTIKITKYLKVLQHVSDHRGSIIRQPCTVLG